MAPPSWLAFAPLTQSTATPQTIATTGGSGTPPARANTTDAALPNVPSLHGTTTSPSSSDPGVMALLIQQLRVTSQLLQLEAARSGDEKLSTMITQLDVDMRQVAAKVASKMPSATVGEPAPEESGTATAPAQTRELVESGAPTPSPAPNPSPPPAPSEMSALQQLTSMGFPEAQAQEALAACGGSVQNAVQMLFANN